MFIIASLSMVLPYAFPCRESGCVTTSAGVVVCNNATMSDAGLQLVIEASTETFTCREVSAPNPSLILSFHRPLPTALQPRVHLPPRRRPAGRACFPIAALG